MNRKFTKEGLFCMEVLQKSFWKLPPSEKGIQKGCIILINWSIRKGDCYGKHRKRYHNIILYREF